LFAVFGASVLVAKLANVVLGVAAIWLACRLAGDWFRGQAVPSLLALILAVYPNFVMYSSLVASEPLFLCCLLGALILFGKAGRSASWALAAGCLAACAVWVKPLALVPLGAYAVWALVLAPGNGRGVRGAIALLGFVLVLSPWTVRNWAVFGGFVFVSTNGGYNLLVGNHPQASGGWHEVRDLVVPGGNEREMDARFRDLAIAHILGDPAGFLSRAPMKLNRLYGQGWDAVNWNLAGLGKVTPRMSAWLRACRTVGGIAWKGLLVLGLVGLVILWRTGAAMEARRGGRWMPLAMIMAISAVHVVFFGDPRFQYPLVPFVGVYASAAVAWFLGGWSPSRG
jgi:4-amino-4-deoxy-L-arabinose transferase-like glycosyltransferase